MSSAPIKIHLHIGDYVRDTEELSLMQHGAYLKLMLWYYSTAKGIPNDFERICRRVRAMSTEERGAIEFVLAEFFSLSADKTVWLQKRIEQELDTWREKTDAAEKSAKARWQKKTNENNETADANALPTQCERNANAMLPVSRVPYPVSRKNTKPFASSDKSLSAVRAGETPVIQIPCVGGEVPIYADLVAELQTLYPAVDIEQTLREIRGWNLANPTRRKTARGVLKHVNAWMMREQNRG